jgi:inner membrane protein
MKGLTHLSIGITTGAALAALTDTVPFTVAGLAVAGFSALAPDLDHPGSRLGRKIAPDYRYLKWAICIGAIVLATGAWFFATGYLKQFLYGISLLVLLAGLVMMENTARKYTLFLMALAITGLAIYLDAAWLFLLGAFIGISPFMKHRTWTHTLWALGLWMYICYRTQVATGLHGTLAMGAVGYLSHLVADSCTPGSIKWFFPLWDKKIGIGLINNNTFAGQLMEAAIGIGYPLLVFGGYYADISLL